MLATNSCVFRFADVTVREREFSVEREGKVQPIEPKAFRVLLVLLRNPNRLISKEELLTSVWGDTAVTENSLTRNIALLRRVLGDDPREPRFIETVASLGYRWLCPVEHAEDSGAVAAQEPVGVVIAGAIAVLKAEAAPRRPGRNRWIWLSAAAAGLGVVLAGGIWFLSRPLPMPRITAYTQITYDNQVKNLGGTDGIRLYFSRWHPEAISQVAVNGGESADLPIAIPVPKPSFGNVIDISPDGSDALISILQFQGTTRETWVAPVLGGAARRLDESDDGTFSPDGASVIYSRPEGDVFMIRTDGTGKHKLANVPSGAGAFRWSPDGRVIRFTKDLKLWEMSADATGAHPLLPAWNKNVEACCGRWTPDSKLFVFCAGHEIWALDERRSLFRGPSSVPFQLTSGPLQWGHPFPGRDGKTIFAEGATVKGELTRIDPKTGSLQPVAGGVSGEWASFSPDGKFVAYSAYPGADLWRVNADGTGRVQLTHRPDIVYNPRWSPDGKEIAYAAANGLHSCMGRISALDGSPQWLMSEDPAVDRGDPTWSPDGKKILFGMGYKGRQDLRIVDLETHQETIVPGSDGLWSPRWSPDGRYILALTPPPWSLTIFDSTTRQWRRLPVKDNPGYPSFSRDSRLIYFLRTGPNAGVFRIPVAGGKEERVLDLTKFHLASLEGGSMSLDLTDVPLLLRDTGTDDIYALTLDEK